MDHQQQQPQHQQKEEEDAEQQQQQQQQQQQEEETQTIASASPLTETDIAEQPVCASVDIAAAAVANLEILSSVNISQLHCSLPLDQVETVLRPCLLSAQSRVSKALQERMESVESQILCALQQAAVEIIEHLGKEAAIRVIVAERKAAVLEQEIVNAKHQALSMLLRLKCSTDAQILESEKKFLIERRRAQDAEGKLATAQYTMKRLKGELRRKGDILEKMQKLVKPGEAKQLDQLNAVLEVPNQRRAGRRGKVTDVHLKVSSQEADNINAFTVGNGNDDSDMNMCSPQILPCGVYPVNVPPVLPSAVLAHNEIPECNSEKQKLERDEEQLVASIHFVNYKDKPNFDSYHSHSGLERISNSSVAEAFSTADMNDSESTGISWKVGCLSNKVKEPPCFRERQLHTHDGCIKEQRLEGRPIEKSENMDSNFLREMEQTHSMSPVRQEGQFCIAGAFRSTDNHDRTSVPLKDITSDTIEGLLSIDHSLDSNDSRPLLAEEEVIAGSTSEGQNNYLCVSSEEASKGLFGQSETIGTYCDGTLAVLADEQGKLLVSSELPANAGTECGHMLKTDCTENYNVQKPHPGLDFTEMPMSQLQMKIRSLEKVELFELQNELREIEKDKIVGEAVEETGNNCLSQPISKVLGEQIHPVSELEEEVIQELQRETKIVGISSRGSRLAVFLSEAMKKSIDSEFVEPDYEQGTSLAIFSEALQDLSQALQANASECEKIDRACKLGLRNKRKAAQREWQGSSEIGKRVTKKQQVSKGQRCFESRSGRMIGKCRASTPVSEKNSLAVESSRDNRRLMQGARQLLSLSEKKWW